MRVCAGAFIVCKGIHRVQGHLSVFCSSCEGIGDQHGAAFCTLETETRKPTRHTHTVLITINSTRKMHQLTRINVGCLATNTAAFTCTLPLNSHLVFCPRWPACLPAGCPDDMLVQWEPVHKAYPRTTYIGRLS